MGYMSFNEYVEKQKGHKKPKIAVVPDYEGPTPSAPETPKGAKKGAVPYKSGKDAPDRNKDDASALGHKGKKSDHYMPKAKHHDTTPGTELKSYPHVKTQEWIEKNKKLSLAEFTKKIKTERFKELGENSTRSYGSIKESVEFCKSDKYVTDFILEMRRQGVFEKVLAAMIQQNESFRVIGKVMRYDESFARALLMNITEITAGTVGDEGEGEVSVSAPMGDEDHDDMDHHDDMHHDEEGEDHEEGDEDHDEEGDEDHDEEGDEDHDEEGDEDHDEEGDEDHDEEGEDHHDDEESHDDDHHDDMPEDEGPQPKENSPLMKAMKNNPEMMKRMMGQY